MENIFILFVILTALFFVIRRRKKGTGSLIASVTVQANPEMVNQAKKLLPPLINKYLPFFDDKARSRVQDEVIQLTMRGCRSETLARILKEKHNVPDDIAPMLASYASSYLMSKYRQLKHERLGGYKYRWSHGHNGRNGCDHGFLDGKIFEYKNPPVVDSENTRANPGEIVPCTCVAVALID